MRTGKRIIILVIAMIVLGTAFCMIYDHQSIFNGDRVKNPDLYFLEFSQMNQEDSHNLELHAGDVLSVDFAISRGKVDLAIGVPGEDAVYRGNALESGAFEITVPQDGKYQISVSARHASGHIRIQTQGKDI